MTTHTWTTTVAHTTDAEFRAWGSELSAKWAVVGLVQTADTGQINWASVTRPGGNTSGGYEIWRFSDSLQATAPIYIKIEYGTNASSTSTTPAIWITVGTGSNGAGAITGTVSDRTCVSRSGAYHPMTAGTYASYLCYKDGSLSLIWKYLSCGVGTSFPGASTAFSVCRTCDGAGAWTATGVHITSVTDLSLGNPVPGRCYAQTLRFATTAAAYARTLGNFCVVPGARVATIAGNNPVHLHWHPVPETVPSLGLCTHPTVLFTLGTFQTALVGSTLRTYFTVGSVMGFGYGEENSGPFSIAMLWE